MDYIKKEMLQARITKIRSKKLIQTYICPCLRDNIGVRCRVLAGSACWRAPAPPTAVHTGYIYSTKRSQMVGWCQKRGN